MACLLVRVNPTSSGAFNGVAIIDPATGRGFNGASVGNGTVFCFAEDASHSSIGAFKVGLESCNSCKIVAGAQPFSLSFSPRIGNADTLLLKAVAGASTYRSSQNPPGLDGGRPIIRNSLDLVLVVSVVVAGLIVIGYAVWRHLRARPAPESP